MLVILSHIMKLYDFVSYDNYRFLRYLAHQMRLFGLGFPSFLEWRSTLLSISKYTISANYSIFVSITLCSYSRRCFPRLPALGDSDLAIWPPLVMLSVIKVLTYVNYWPVCFRYNLLRKKFPATSFTGSPVLTEAGFDLLNKLLTYDPEKVSLFPVSSIGMLELLV